MEHAVQNHFEQIHSIIEMHRSRALQVVNNESLLTCWNVGQYVSEKLESSLWGSKVVTQLSEYLRTKDPSLKGYSRRNIYNMVRFFESYSSDEFLRILKSLNAQLEFVQTETAQLICLIISLMKLCSLKLHNLKGQKIFRQF